MKRLPLDLAADIDIELSALPDDVRLPATVEALNDWQRWNRFVPKMPTPGERGRLQEASKVRQLRVELLRRELVPLWRVSGQWTLRSKEAKDLAIKIITRAHLPMQNNVTRLYEEIAEAAADC